MYIKRDPRYLSNAHFDICVVAANFNTIPRGAQKGHQKARGCAVADPHNDFQCLQLYVCLCKRKSKYIYIHMYICKHIYIYMYTYIYTCIYIYMSHRLAADKVAAIIQALQN